MDRIMMTSHNKLVILLSPPRSGSTALLRWFEQTGIFEIFHEPSICPYDLIHYPDLTKGWFNDSAYRSYAKVHTAILDALAHRNVFVKDMAFSSECYLACPEIMKRATFIILVRHPVNTAISLYRNYPHWDEVTRNVFSYDHLTNIMVQSNDLIYLVAEKLYNDPRRVLTELCAKLSIPFEPSSLQWKAKPSYFDGRCWHEGKTPELFQMWHHDAIESTGFGPLGCHNPRDPTLPAEMFRSIVRAASSYESIVRMATE